MTSIDGGARISRWTPPPSARSADRAERLARRRAMYLDAFAE